jgi:DsbC/DsbD-like thiol-disulfide interchange protein
MVKKNIAYAAAVLFAVASLASCGTVGVQSERPRSVTNDHEQNQINDRIERNKAERAARAAKGF